MDRIYQVTDHPVLTGIKREVLYTTMVDKPMEEYIKIFFTIRYYKLIDDVKTSITGLVDRGEFIEANNTLWVDINGDRVIPLKNEDGDDITTDLTRQYDYFMNLFDTETPPNIFDVIEYYICKNFIQGHFD